VLQSSGHTALRKSKETKVVLKQLAAAARSSFLKQSIVEYFLFFFATDERPGKYSGRKIETEIATAAQKLCRQAVTFGAQPWRKYPSLG